MSTNRNRNMRRRGVAATEMALLLPFLALLFCVAIDFCRAFQTAQVMDSCARNGALYASGTAGRDPSSTTPEEAARQATLAEGASLNPPLLAAWLAQLPPPVRWAVLVR